MSIREQHILRMLDAGILVATLLIFFQALGVPEQVLTCPAQTCVGTNPCPPAIPNQCGFTVSRVWPACATREGGCCQYGCRTWTLIGTAPECQNVQWVICTFASALVGGVCSSNQCIEPQPPPPPPPPIYV